MGPSSGLVAAKGLAQLERLIEPIEQDRTLPELVGRMFAMLVGQYRHVSARIREIEARLIEVHRASPLSRRLAKAPTIGPVTAVTLTAKVADPKAARAAISPPGSV